LPAQIRPLQEELSAVLMEARRLEDEQENARKQFREMVRRRQELERRGEEARRRLAALLRGTFGFKSEELIPFGLNPLPRNPAASRRRKKKAESDERDKTGKPAEPAAS
jgi:hypothetical protein